MQVAKFNQKYYRVNDQESGLRNDILTNSLGQLETMLKYHNKVHVIRFDLHQPVYTETNERITTFNRRLFKWLKKRYQLNRIGFVWCREQERAKRQHYHYVLMLDGNKVDHPSFITAKTREVWQNMGGEYFLPKNAFYNLERNNDEQTQEAIWRISYLAKTRGKGYRPSQTKDFSTSRLK